MEELNGYTPPASLNLNDFQDAIGDAVVQAIIKIGIRVNREELLKALKYDRGQYKAGYDAGFADGFIETLHIVRCKDCIHRRKPYVYAAYRALPKCQRLQGRGCLRGNERLLQLRRKEIGE